MKSAVRVLLFFLKPASGANQKKMEKGASGGNIKKKKNRTRSLPYFIAEDACQ